MTELYTFRVATMFTADTHFQVGFGNTSSFSTGFDQLTDTFLVNGLERIIGQNFQIKVFWQEATDIIPAEAKAHLCEVVGAETEEVC